MTTPEELPPRLAELARNSGAQLAQAVRDYGKVVYSTSLGPESAVMTDLICTFAPDIDMFTIDTGRLPDETLALLDRVERRYERRIKVYYPDSAAVEAYVQANGINGFYSGLEERQSCCHVRKVEPFKRAVVGYKAWITGVRREQSAERAKGEVLAWDDRHDMWKVSPLLDWTEEDIWDFIRVRNLPYNPLHDKGYPSIGCAPCTRAIALGEDHRAGRWWWEQDGARECGLHTHALAETLSPLR